MSESDTDDEPEAAAGRPSPRYASFQTEDGHCVLYDTDHVEAWIQTDTAMAREEVR